MKPKAFYVGILLFIIFLFSSFAQQDKKVQRWHTDIDFILKQIEMFHPHPWHRLTREKFLNKLDSLKTEIPVLSEEKIIVRAMQLVASLCDGHTSLTPYNHPLIPIWFPLRMDKFEDGIFITSIAREYEEFIGAKVIRIGKLTAEECFELVGYVNSVDSPVGFQTTAPVYISNATILKGLDIIAENTSLPLEVLLSDGKRATAILASTRWPFVLGWTRNRN